MRCLYRMRPYELTPGSSDAVHEKWVKLCRDFVSSDRQSYSVFKKMCKDIVADFDSIPIDEELKKPRVGVVGEILVKYSPTANNDLVSLIENEGAEAVVPDLLDFMQYCFYNQIYKADHLGKSRKTAFLSRMGTWFLDTLRGAAIQAFKESRHFTPPVSIFKIVNYAEDIVSIGNQTGEGWFLTGEMIELIHSEL